MTRTLTLTSTLALVLILVYTLTGSTHAAAPQANTRSGAENGRNSGTDNSATLAPSSKPVQSNNRNRPPRPGLTKTKRSMNHLRTKNRKIRNHKAVTH